MISSAAVRVMQARTTMSTPTVKDHLAISRLHYSMSSWLHQPAWDSILLTGDPPPLARSGRVSKSTWIDMRRLLLSSVVGAALLGIPLLYVGMFPSAACPAGMLCEPSDLEGALGLFLLPGLLLALPAMPLLPAIWWLAAAIGLTFLVYVTMIWFWLRRRDRRAQASPPTLFRSSR
jgi:hypothetical protein